jgi:hypothetical protein
MYCKDLHQDLDNVCVKLNKDVADYIIAFLEKGFVILHFGKKYYSKSRRNTSSLRIKFEIWQIAQQKIIGW